LQKDPAEDIVIYPKNEGDMFKWTAFLKGPPETPYEGGTFELDIVIPQNYPHHAPNIKFVTKIFHPNIHFKKGEICLDLLKAQWSAVFTLQSVCRSIIALLSHPEPDSPLNCDCGNLLRSGDKRGYNSMARMYTRLYATFAPSTKS